MKAAVLTAPYRMEIREIKKPIFSPDEVLIKVKGVGVCGSDVHAYKGTHPFRKPPVILGHEVAGEIAEVGKEVETLKRGDRVTLEPQVVCYNCSLCRQGKYNLCKEKRVLGTSRWLGGFAEYIAVPEAIIFKLGDKMSFEDAVMVEPLAVGVHTAKMAKLNLGDTAVILGAGTIGLTTLVAVREAGATRIIATDTEDFNLKMAKQLGALRGVNVKRENLRQIVMDNTSGEGADVVVVAAGVSSLVEDALEIVKKGGTVVVVAIMEESAQIDTFKIVYNEVDIVGSWVYGKDDFQAVMDLINSERIKPGSFVTHRWPIEKAQQAMEVIDKKTENVVKIMLTFD